MQEQDELLDDIIHQMQVERRLSKGFSPDSRLSEPEHAKVRHGRLGWPLNLPDQRWTVPETRITHA